MLEANFGWPPVQDSSHIVVSRDSGIQLVGFARTVLAKIANFLKKLLEAHLRLEIQSELESFVKSQSLEALKSKLF